MTRPPVDPHVLAVARGDEPADLLLRGGRVLGVHTREWVATDLAIAGGVIAGWGPREAHEVLELDGAALTPGFVDAHMHLESTKLWVDAFARTVLPHGTTAVVADPHELANVLGVPGILALMRAAAEVPLTFAVSAASCVPASPFESAGASLDAGDIAGLIEAHGAHGVGEVMNFPGVVAGEAEMLARIAAAGPGRADGHAPGVRGPDLDAYLAAGVESDHEATSAEEALEKRRKGLWVFLREGSASRDVAALAPAVIGHGTDRAALCTDDREPDTLLADGHVNDCVRVAVRAGIPEIDALVLATARPAEYHGLRALGSLDPGAAADVLAFEHLAGLEPSRVWRGGRLVAADGALVGAPVPAVAPDALLRDTIHLGRRPGAGELVLGVDPGTRVRALGAVEHSLTTRDAVGVVGEDDLAHAAVVERHRASGRIGRGFATGFGLRRGAIASSVAHDAHNLVCLGGPVARDGPAGGDMAVAIARLAELGGGQVAVLDGRVLAEVALPLAGLMSDRPAEEVAAGLRTLSRAAREALGVRIAAPFMQLSFIALSVIPALRITDGGPFDVGAFAHVEPVLG